MKEHSLPECKCLGCGKILDRASSFKHDSDPTPGSVTICITCGHVMIFTDDMGLRNPSPAEIRDLAGDEDILLIQRIRRELELEDKYGPSKSQQRGEKS